MDVETVVMIMMMMIVTTLVDKSYLVKVRLISNLADGTVYSVHCILYTIQCIKCIVYTVSCTPIHKCIP